MDKSSKDSIYEDIKVLKTLNTISEEYGHLTLNNIIERFKAKIKFLMELEQQKKNHVSRNQS